MMNGWDTAGSDWAWMFVMMVIGVALVAVLVAWLVQQVPMSNPQPIRESPLDILAERLARGEIDETDYQRLRRALGK